MTDPVRKLLVILAAFCLLPAAAQAAPHASAAARSAARLSHHPVAEDSAWLSLVESPSSSDVHPVRILSTTGDVSDVQALVGGGSGETTLHYALGDTAPSIVLDFGQDVGGLAQFDVASATPDTLRVAYSEQLVNLSGTGDEAATPGLFLSGALARFDDLAVSAPGVISSPEVQGGQRYERLTLTSPGTLVLRSATIHITTPDSSAVTLAGHFLSSDSLLNRVWYAGLYTLNLDMLPPGATLPGGAANHLHLLLDGAKRDRAVWSGDQLISDLTDLYSVGDAAYPHGSLALFGDHPASSAALLIPSVGVESAAGPLPGVCSPNPTIDDLCLSWSASYSMVFVPALEQYYRYTGDLAFVRAEWQSVHRQMAWDAQQVDSSGLFAVNTLDATDWDVQMPTGELTYVNAVYVEALGAAAQLAAALGDSAQAQAYAAAAAKVTAAVNAKLWDPATGVYDASTTERGPIVQDANVTAILAGIAAGARAREILGVLAARLASPYGALDVTSPVPSGYRQLISPYMGGFQIQADFDSGLPADALALIHTEWGHMVDGDPGDTDWEKIFDDGTLGSLGSAAHGWSTGPTSALPEYVLGVTPATPGYASWAITPQLSGLRWAQGTVPTPHGTITVRWRRGTKSFELSMRAPAGTSGTVAVPLLGARRTIAENGRIVWNGRRAAHGVHVLINGGEAVFSGVTGGATFAWG
jgi:hypothetical protein